ncbi:gamma-aminobutyric acid receptor subunit alpha-6-like isoform X3 [Macrobrachium rosenbergii]|uniref:gamma-aminobutyric acid receptor subunit alpha-6-like isoform X3 n=1 Tax=Macrobrachium rosenbergii TaxID=79674 RepID=UPI0034D65400
MDSGVSNRGMWWWWCWWRWWCIVVVVVGVADPTQGFSSTYTASGFSKNVTNLLDSLLADYDRRIRPGHGGPPTTIMVNMNVRSMGPFSEKEESYSMQLYLRQVWFDTRLRFNKTDLGKSEFSMNWMFAAKLWKPDTFFINGKNSYAHKITAPNTFIRLQHDGQITWSLRLTVRASCKMHLRKFPLDTQICPLTLASYGYNSDDILYKWAPALVTVDADVSIAQYELFDIKHGDDIVVVRRKESISTLIVKFHLKRLTGFFLLQVYVPCILIVCCSWVAFWITKKDVPGRVCLGVTTVLSMTTLGFGGRSAWPAVSYATALDYFVILCFAFVFAAVLEFACINFVERAANKRRKKLEDLKHQITERIMAAEKDATMQVTTTVKEDGGVDIGSSLRNTLKVGLSVVPMVEEALEEAEASGKDTPVDAQASLKEALKLPLSVVPESLEAVQDAGEREGLRERIVTPSRDKERGGGGGGGSGVDSGGEEVEDDGLDRTVVSGEVDPLQGKRDAWIAASDSGSMTSRGSLFKFNKKDKMKRERSQDSESDSTVIKVDIQPDDEQPPPPPPPFTVWQMLTRKRKIMSEMTPSNTVLSEEDVLERFSIIDLYARRIFPTAFFILFTIYWVMFNYYITDEFPHESKVPSDGLIVV